MTKNEIILKIYIRDKNSKERIINSFENIKREHANLESEKIEVKENIEEIKDCEIYINDKKIDFTYYYTFNKK